MDICTEKTLLVNPNCPVRIMLEFIRKKCRLAITTQFDLCDESGVMKNLFSYPTFQYVTQQFEHKKIYYLIVIKVETDKMISVLPQLSRDNKLYVELQTKVKKYIHGYSGLDSSQHTSSGKLRSSMIDKNHHLSLHTHR
ncbi:uncharacterized protein LOC126374153 [Pectinophora gossypiella]|uniref:uncharacterized protein LOC126374153 n=1 Tax=Pectinophora gossypiella TaxID=13191 RepID=UPI00214E171D|nr:uncharacterized protein LOC126374153 [Pectinophora gossypiella]XP_049876591.1 uncharacterized protein LOC126374153 [Pectinophora gossypiella]XP_049876601.1 uncharacterized protein LOC126374153 [Pectinophora gossypiella]